MYNDEATVRHGMSTISNHRAYDNNDEEDIDDNQGSDSIDDAAVRVGDGDERGVTLKSSRKGPPRLDAIKLTGEFGLEKLLAIYDRERLSKSQLFHTKSGYERHDLKRLLDMYREWATLLHPRTPFTQTMQRVKRLGGDKIVRDWVSQRREERRSEELTRSRRLNLNREKDNEVNVNHEDNRQTFTSEEQFDAAISNNTTTSLIQGADAHLEDDLGYHVVDGHNEQTLDQHVHSIDVIASTIIE